RRDGEGGRVDWPDGPTPEVHGKGPGARHGEPAEASDSTDGRDGRGTHERSPGHEGGDRVAGKRREAVQIVAKLDNRLRTQRSPRNATARLGLDRESNDSRRAHDQ